VQGIAAAGALTLQALLSARLGRRRVVYSPHDTFSRRGRLDAWLLRSALRVPHAVVVHSQADVQALRATGIPALYSPLVQLVSPPDESRRRRWRHEWRAEDGAPVVLFAGWIRPEKRLDLLIQSARSWPPGRRLAVLGEDRGAWEDCARLAERCGVEVAARVQFVDLEDFTAALAAADVVVAPHDKAAQSGVLSLARQLGVPTVASDVGGLSELASRTFVSGDVEDLTRAIDAALADTRVAGVTLDEGLAIDAHLRAYCL
jgi:glycosyltransferase involved in cell wall biosynthesis